ncbi:hypothetical protein ACO0RG_004760 [Hanseniaspora osmophila]
MQNKHAIKVVVCGDEHVGKTTLIANFVKNQYIPHLQKRLTPVSIPREFSDNPGFPETTILIDTTLEDTYHLQESLETADVILLVYADDKSYDRISSHWFSMFRSLGLNLPVIVCRNKCDLLSSQDYALVDDEDFLPILNDFKEVGSCIKASCLDNHNVHRTFFLCQRSIMFPLAPLYDSRIQALKPSCASALKRIFILSDKDQDGFLNVHEIAQLQRKSFNKSINISEVEDLIQHIQELRIPNTCSRTRGLTKYGFLLLNTLYIEKGRYETVWGMLRAFHYTDTLEIDEHILFPNIGIHQNSTCSIELSPVGYRFLVDVFRRYDRDNDGGLDDYELKQLFKSCPEGIPQLWLENSFPNSTPINNDGHITLQGWLAQWTMTTFLDYKITTKYLVYFGFEQNAKNALHITKQRKMKKRSGKLYRAPVSDRKVFNCFVLGKPNSGKTALMESFLNKQIVDSGLYSPTIRPQIAVNSMELKGGKQFYLILQEFGGSEAAVVENEAKWSECDVVCLAYDSSDPNSFAYLVEMIDKYSFLKKIPMVFVGLKADLDRQQQRCHFQPDEFTDLLYLDHPLHVSVYWQSSLSKLFSKLVYSSLEPLNATPGFEPALKQNDEEFRQTVVMISTGVGFVGLFSFFIYKLLKK